MIEFHEHESKWATNKIDTKVWTRSKIPSYLLVRIRCYLIWVIILDKLNNLKISNNWIYE